MTWWRIDAQRPDEWAWTAFPTPRSRFDPATGRFRVRYGANRPAVAARERFPARVITPAEGEHWLVELAGGTPALHLTHQANLDALDLDDRISTGWLDAARRADPDPLLLTSSALSDAVYDWWGGQPPPLVYRSRATPGVARNMAFTETASLPSVRARLLREATALHAYLVLRAGFTVPEDWLV